MLWQVSQQQQQWWHWDLLCLAEKLVSMIFKLEKLFKVTPISPFCFIQPMVASHQKCYLCWVENKTKKLKLPDSKSHSFSKGMFAIYHIFFCDLFLKGLFCYVSFIIAWPFYPTNFCFIYKKVPQGQEYFLHFCVSIHVWFYFCSNDMCCA